MRSRSKAANGQRAGFARAGSVRSYAQDYHVLRISCSDPGFLRGGGFAESR
jgi:hypothetical protein